MDSDTETNAEGTCFNKNISTHLPRHFFQASCDILRWLVTHVGALCLCHMAFLIFSESNRGQTFIFLIKAYGVWRISWIAKSWQDFHTFYVCLFSLSMYKHTHALPRSGPPDYNASGQSDACLPALRWTSSFQQTDGEITEAAPSGPAYYGLHQL